VPPERGPTMVQAKAAEAGEHLSFRVTRAEGGDRLDRFLRKRIPWRSRTNLQALIATGLVLLNGAPARPAARVGAGDAVETPVRDPRAAARESFEYPLSVLIDDPDFLVIDKPPHLATHPTARHLRRNALAAVRALVGEPAPKPVHRLDLETSGVLLFARTRDAHRALALQFERREVEKRDLAVVTGRVGPGAGILDPPLGRHAGSHVRIRMRAGASGGRPARTDFRVLRRWRGFTFLELVPHTGRQHQIRAQLEAFGHPVVGDKIYGPDERHFLDHLEGRLSAEARESLLLDRHALHAARLVFRHPRTAARIDARAPLPTDLARFIESLPEEG
jgi:23S rRNA pseudouridine1911/1915/1917 synthase